MWALVTDGSIAAISLDLPAGDGWLQVAEAPRPDDTDEVDS